MKSGLSGQKEFASTDSINMNGNVSYQAYVKAKDGRLFYSDVIDFFGLKKDEIILAPVPIKRGMILDVHYDGGEEALIELYDSKGKLCWSSTQNGIIKTIPTTGLVSGLYHVKVHTKENVLTSKLITKD